jgi:multiple sugar transport system ATP-binding protein
MAIVETRALRKEFVGHCAVDGVDLTINEGEFLVLLGPSGCGKTTLLRMIAGLEQQTSGDVVIGGQLVNDLPPRARKIAMVFQSYALYPHLTVAKNIAFPLKAQGAPRGSIAGEVDKAAGMFGIGHLLERKPRALSGGERQRVALARAMVRHPDVFLLDEPLSNLDAKLRNLARDELKQFQRRLGTTTLYVTHDQVEAMGLGDRIAVMNKGKVRQLGAPQEVYDEPADTFVAGFLGSPPMNLIPHDGVLVGFRPEQLLPAGEVPSPGASVSLRFHVERVENLGADRLLYGTLPDLAPGEKLIVNLPYTVHAPIQPGQTQTFVIGERALKFFDPSTGLRLPPRPLRKVPG